MYTKFSKVIVYILKYRNIRRCLGIEGGGLVSPPACPPPPPSRARGPPPRRSAWRCDMLDEELYVASNLFPVPHLERGHERHAPQLQRHCMQQLFSFSLVPLKPKSISVSSCLHRPLIIRRRRRKQSSIWRRRRKQRQPQCVGGFWFSSLLRGTV